MCGIFGYVGKKNCKEIIFKGLKTLEYRGYDSSGIATISSEQNISIIKAKGKLKELEQRLDNLPDNDHIGIGHTRWATHGIANDTNAHPHSNANFAIVHNGIIENYKELKKELSSKGKVFKSKTDTEVVLHLLQVNYEESSCFIKAIKKTTQRLKGAYALGIIHKDAPKSIYLIKKDSPLVIGQGLDDNFFASDVLALNSHTKKVIFLEEERIARLENNNISIMSLEGNEVDYTVETLKQNLSCNEKDNYKHFMLKEIHEQPQIFATFMEKIYNPTSKKLNLQALGLNIPKDYDFERMVIVACGSAYYAGATGQYIVEDMLHIPVTMELASEFRYRRPHINEKTLVLAISQSGETADTIASIDYAKKHSCKTIAICNSHYSTISRMVDHCLQMEAGAEIGVASTKAFTTMILSIYSISLNFAYNKKLIKTEDLAQIFEALSSLPSQCQTILNQQSHLINLARKYYHMKNFIYVGRGINFPLALEGALKLKEISYIHAEGFAAGELKHGPIALIDQTSPVFAVAPQGEEHSKMLSNIEEISARNGLVLSMGYEDDIKLKDISTDFISIPKNNNKVAQAILSTIPLQLFAYYMAISLGTDVDQPRNLAKSVTVE